MNTNLQCHQCGLKFETPTVCPTCKTSDYLLNLNNPIDRFIANQNFEKTLKEMSINHEKTNT